MMKDICAASLAELKTLLDEGSVTSIDIVRALKAAYQADEKQTTPLHGFIEFFDDAEAQAEKADALRKEGKTANKPLLGLPFAVKDNISIRGKLCTCCSKILDGYRAPYSATVITRLMEAGAIPIGRANMDEFAMGSSTEYSVYGPSHNPVDRTLTPGGSSGGSAAVVAGFQVPFALGTETGGSVRLPASYCGIYGLKPTYGAISRYGVVAFGSSLDQVGLLARCVDDVGLGLSVAGGVDPYDETSVRHDFSACAHLQPYTDSELKKLRIALPVEFIQTKGLQRFLKNSAVGSLQKVFKSILFPYRCWNLQLRCTMLSHFPKHQVTLPVLTESATAYARIRERATTNYTAPPVLPASDAR